MPDEEELRVAEQQLAGFPEYDWLRLSNTLWWTVSEVAEHLGVGRDVVRAWCERHEVPGAVLYAPQVGWRMPRSGLVVFCAKRQGWQQGKVG